MKFDAARRYYMGKKLDAMLPFLTAGATGVDLGCGGGEYVIELLRAGYHVVGIDLEIPQGPFVRADMRRLPFSDGYFDFAYAVNSLHHLPSRAAQRQALTEAARVLRPGGLLFIHEMNACGNPLLRFWLRHVFTRYGSYDDGTERWLKLDGKGLMPRSMTPVHYETFTFVPDFVRISRLTQAVEARLESSRWRRYGVHRMGVWEREAATRQGKLEL